MIFGFVIAVGWVPCGKGRLLGCLIGRTVLSTQHLHVDSWFLSLRRGMLSVSWVRNTRIFPVSSETFLLSGVLLTFARRRDFVTVFRRESTQTSVFQQCTHTSSANIERPHGPWLFDVLQAKSSIYMGNGCFSCAVQPWAKSSVYMGHRCVSYAVRQWTGAWRKRRPKRVVLECFDSKAWNRILHVPSPNPSKDR